MICGNCGMNVPDGYVYCPGCGAPLQSAQPTYGQPVYSQPAYSQPDQAAQPVYGEPVQTVQSAQPVYGEPIQTAQSAQSTYGQPEYNQVESGLPTVSPGLVLGMGIASMATGELGLLGMIFAIIGLCKAAKYYKTAPVQATSVKIGKILSIIGLVYSSIFFLFYALISWAFWDAGPW